MVTESTSEPIHIERNPLGVFTFYSDYAIAEWHNPEIDSFAFMRMEKVAKSVYAGRRWGYISNRTHATVSNPNAVYQMLQRDFTPVAVAIVTYSMRSQIVARIEKDYCKSVSLEIFTNLDNAIKWVQEQVNQVDSQTKENQNLFA